MSLGAEFALPLVCLRSKICGPKWGGQTRLSSFFCLREWNHTVSTLTPFTKMSTSPRNRGCLASDKEDGTFDVGGSWGSLDQSHLRAWSLRVPGKRLRSRDASSLLCFSVIHVCFPQKKFFFFIIMALPRNVMEGALLAGAREAHDAPSTCRQWVARERASRWFSEQVLLFLVQKKEI